MRPICLSLVCLTVHILLSHLAESTSLRHRHHKDHKNFLDKSEFDLPSIDTSDFVLNRFIEISDRPAKDSIRLTKQINPGATTSLGRANNTLLASTNNTLSNVTVESNETLGKQNQSSDNHSSNGNVTHQGNNSESDAVYNASSDVGDSSSNASINSSLGDHSSQENHTNATTSNLTKASQPDSAEPGFNSTNNSSNVTQSANKNETSNSSSALTSCNSTAENASAEGLTNNLANGKTNAAGDSGRNHPTPNKNGNISLLKIESVVKGFEDKRNLLKISKKFRMLSSNPAFQPLLARLTEFNNEIKRIGVMNQMVYEKINNSLLAFNDLKQHIGVIERVTLQNLISNYTSGENIIRQEAKIVSTDIKKLKKDMITFYNSNIEGVNSSQSDLEDLVNIKKSLLEQIKKTKTLTKINFLQTQILDKLKTIVTDFQNSLIKESFRNEANTFYVRLNRIHSHYYTVHPIERAFPTASRAVFYHRIPQAYMIKNLIKIDECI